MRGRVSDFALAVNGASWLTIANVSFHATTISITGDVGNVSLSSLEFNYSAGGREGDEGENILSMFTLSWACCCGRVVSCAAVVCCRACCRMCCGA